MFPIFNINNCARSPALLTALALSLAMGLAGCVEENDGGETDTLIDDDRETGSDNGSGETGTPPGDDDGDDSGSTPPDNDTEEGGDQDDGSSGGSDGGALPPDDDTDDGRSDDEDSNEGSDDEGDDGSSDDEDATSGEVTLSWEPPESREDGSDFMATEVDYYEVAYGPEPGEYAQTFETINTSATINSLNNGDTYYFTVRVHDDGGLTSEYATEVSKTIND